MQCVPCVCLCAVRFELEKTQNTFWRKIFVCSVFLPQRIEKWATLKRCRFSLRPAPTLIQSGAKIGIVCIKIHTIGSQFGVRVYSKTPVSQVCVCVSVVSHPTQTLKVLYVSGAVLSTYLKILRKLR